MNKEPKEKTSAKIISIILIAIFVLAFIKITGAVPNGATINFSSSSSFGPQGASANISAYAGNVSEINIYGVTLSSSWQGYVGNVTGGFLLADSAGNIFYNWSSVSSGGEIYASRNGSIIWTNMECFNFTANGTYNDDSANRGNYSLYGMNESQLETAYNISSEDADGISETFELKDHNQFYTNGLKFDTGECQNTRIMNSSGVGVFQEVLLYSPDNREVVFAALLQSNTLGYNDKLYDFEMMVLDDGHAANTEPTSYFFYIELG